MTMKRISTLDGLDARALALAFLAACAVLMLRRPDALLHAQFQGEDGPIWYATAYNYGWWRVLFSPYEGYLNLLPRLGAGLALLFPFGYGPLVENLIAIAVEAMPAVLLLSRRLSTLGSLRFRAALALLYLLLPNMKEMIATLTESQWFLALSVLLILLAAAPESRIRRALDLALLALCGLSGPFCLFLSPVAIAKLLQGPKDPYRRLTCIVLFSCCAAQGVALALTSSHRPHPALGAGLLPLLRIFAGHICIGTLLGSNGLAVGGHAEPAIYCVALAGIALGAWSFRACRFEMRAMFFVSALIFAASLAAPTAFPRAGQTAWGLLATAPGIRYWFFPCLAFAWMLADGVRSRQRALRIVSASLLTVMIFGVLRDFRIATLSDLHFAAWTQRFAAAPSGSTTIVPTNPDWRMVLTKH